MRVQYCLDSVVSREKKHHLYLPRHFARFMLSKISRLAAFKDRKHLRDRDASKSQLAYGASKGGIFISKEPLYRGEVGARSLPSQSCIQPVIFLHPYTKHGRRYQRKITLSSLPRQSFALEHGILELSIAPIYGKHIDFRLWFHAIPSSNASHRADFADPRSLEVTVDRRDTTLSDTRFSLY